MPPAQILQIPNLVSLTRILLTPFVGYFLWRGDSQSTLICASLLVVAAITDFLDGYLARRLGQVTRLGIALDPLCDKIFAGALVVMLVLFRGFPVWLAAAIVGRDLVIVGAGLYLMRGRDIDMPSNLTGKYAFAAIAVLLGSYVIRFDFGITLMIWITVALLVASIVSYSRVFVIIKRGLSPRPFSDRPLFRTLRIAVAVMVAVVYLHRLFLYLAG